MAIHSKSALRTNLKAMRRSLRASMAPVPLPTGNEVLHSLRRQLQKVKSGTSSGLSCLASALARTAGGLACCARPAVMETEYDLEVLESGYNDYQNGTTVDERYQALQTIPAQDPKRTISAVAKEALLATFKLATNLQDKAAVIGEISPDITAYCFQDDAFQVEAEPAELAFDDDAWDPPTGDTAREEELQSLQPPMPLVPELNGAQQQPGNPGGNDEDLPVSWDEVIMATADFAALPAETWTCGMLEEETASLFDQDIQQQSQERQQALEMRAAAAAAQGDQHKLSAEEVQALRAQGKAIREAAAAERAAKLQEIDAALRDMKEIERAHYFEAEVCSNEADTQVQVSDKWEDPEVLALVEGLARLRALESGQ